MRFLPVEHITYRTTLKEQDIIKRLRFATGRERSLSFEPDSINSIKTYEGKISEQTFDIKRIITYRNDFSPRIKGTIETTIGGTMISVKMRLSKSTFIFLCFWCGGVGFGFFRLLLRALEFDPEMLLFLGMFLFAYVLTMGSFKPESNKAKKDLQKIFEADIIDE